MTSIEDDTAIMRREFVKMSAAIIGGLGIPGLLSETTAVAAENDRAQTGVPDESYVEKGLIGMARSKGWFNAHLGAAVLAGYYMCKENSFSEALVTAIQQQLDALIQVHADQFTPFAEMTAKESLIEDVPASLAPAVEGGLRAHGHAVIYTALAVRALRDAPHMADAQLIKHLCSHNAEIARKTPTRPAVPTNYADTQAMVEALFNSLARFEPLLGRPSVRRPNFTHMTTHTEALVSLEALGYADLAGAGQLGQQAHISEPVPSFDPAEHPLEEHSSTLADVMSEKYWESAENRRQWNKAWNQKTNPNGYWLAFGHLFKVLYSYHRLIGRISDQDKVRLCSRILLERCVNPNVQGG
ncbi:MAG: hypothetical protein KDA89_19540 [Planctomycetaceae bacterium]|nr:hypothetical protein [Planctomycetaceae bacterium]